MKVSYNWLKEYLPIDLPAEELADMLTSLGLEVESVKKTESLKGGLRGVVAGKVIDCVKHPNADRLSLCTVDIGEERPLSIVCGAPNVAADQVVWVAQVGTTLYPAGSDKPLEIGKAKVRGKVSEGMICAEDELGLGEDHSGIMVLDDDVEPGKEATEYYEISEDIVIDIDLTPNRSDATCHLGIAEDLAAYLQVNDQRKPEVVWPDTDHTIVQDAAQEFRVEVQNSAACPRYAGMVISGITVGDSPPWLQNRLRSVDVRPINNVVDVTNFVLHEMGQPLHAFDAEKITGDHIIVRTLPDGTPFVTLDEVERKLTSKDLMICDGESAPMCIAGVFGGIGTGVTEKTTGVFLESAHFNPEWIRRTSMHHLLRTDAARTFEKSTDPNVCVKALLRAADLIMEIAGGTQSSGLIDIYPEKIEPARVRVRWSRINLLTGIEMDRKKVKEILEALSMQITEEDTEAVTVAVPTNKADVTREADVIEEILRIYGYNNVPMTDRMEISLTRVERPTMNTLRDTIGAFLSAQGFHEMMGLSMTERSYVEEGPLALPGEQQVHIENTSNVSLSLMRPDMLITALETAAYNQNRRQDDFKFYEFGFSYRRSGEDFIEKEHLTLTLSGFDTPLNWRDPQAEPADFYVLKKYVIAVLGRIGLTRHQVTPLDDSRYTYGLRYHLGKRTIVEFGQVSETLIRQFDLKKGILYADFSMKELLNAFSGQAQTVREVSRYPAVIRDLSLNLPSSVQYAVLEKSIRKSGGDHLREIRLFDVYESAEHLGEGRKSYAVQLVFEDPTRTLTDDEVDVAIQKIVQSVESDLDGMLRG